MSLDNLFLILFRHNPKIYYYIVYNYIKLFISMQIFLHKLDGTQQVLCVNEQTSLE